MKTPDYNVIFQDGHTLHKLRNQHNILHTRRIGELYLPSGTLIGRDPNIGIDGLTIGPAVALGRYPVSVTLAMEGFFNELAFASVRFKSSAPARWEAAHGVDEQSY